MSQSMAGVMEAIFSSVGSEITSALTNSMGTLMGGISDNLLNAFKFNTDGLADMFKTEMSAEELKDLMLSLFNTQKSTYESNLKKLGYADLDKPGSITIYPNEYFNPFDDITGLLRKTPNTRSIHWYAKTWADNSHPWLVAIKRWIRRTLGTGFTNAIKGFLRQ